MYCTILQVNVRNDMIYLLGLCNFTKLSNICHRDLSKVLKHPIRIDMLKICHLRNNNQLVSEFPIKNINVSITDVNTVPGQTPVSYPNQAFANIVNQAIHNYCEPSQMKPAAIIYTPMYRYHSPSSMLCWATLGSPF